MALWWGPLSGSGGSDQPSSSEQFDQLSCTRHDPSLSLALPSTLCDALAKKLRLLRSASTFQETAQISVAATEHGHVDERIIDNLWTVFGARSDE